MMTFMLFYILPFFIIIIGTSGLVKQDKSVIAPIFVLALIPGLNLCFAFVVVVLLLYKLVVN